MLQLVEFGYVFLVTNTNQDSFCPSAPKLIFSNMANPTNSTRPVIRKQTAYLMP